MEHLENSRFTFLIPQSLKGFFCRLFIMIQLAKPDINEADIQSVEKVLRSGWLSLGPQLKAFEEAFAKKIGCRFAVGVNSGTSGLHLALRALGIKAGDEVITSTFSFIASSNCAIYQGATPRFVDVDLNTFNLDSKKLEEKITPKTKAIVIPHIFGQSCDMTELMAIARKHNLFVVEDACESILATHSGKKLGTFGDVAVFAFYPNKQMTTGEGGMIVTNNESIEKYCRSAANQGRGDTMQWLSHDKLGYNYRIDEMSCALGLSQLSRIEEFVAKRIEIAAKYSAAFQEVDYIQTLEVPLNNTCSWFVYPIRVPERVRDRVIELLCERDVQAKAYFFPCIHQQPFYRTEYGYSDGDFPEAEKLSKETIVLPFFTDLSDEQIVTVVEAVKTSIAIALRE